MKTEPQNKLSIEHIAKRFPYGLIIKPKLDFSDNKLERVFYLSDKYKKETFKVNGYNSSEILLILFPMKYINEDIIVNGETKCFYDYFGLSEPNEHTDFSKYTEEQWRSIPWFSHEEEELLKYHFDTDGLIDAGLAISVFDLEQNPYA